VRAYGRRVSVVDVRVFRACARGECLLGVINIIIITTAVSGVFYLAGSAGSCHLSHSAW
jgi:hypothetical protein